MKKVLLIGGALSVLMFGGCATNFASWSEWKQDKAGERYAAEVLTSELKADGYIYGTAKVYRDGKIVNYIQKPYLTPNTPFSKGTTIFVEE